MGNHVAFLMLYKNIYYLTDTAKRGVDFMSVLNIFTDASLITVNNITSTCAGFVSTVDMNDSIIHNQTLILPNSTNNIGESTAILLGINYAANMHKAFDTVNLFSDSQWCIYSLMHWIHTWIRTIDANGIMYNSSGEPVKNQNIFENIINAVVFEDIHINLFHVRGHINPLIRKDLDKARSNFIVANKLSPRGADKITDQTLSWMAKMNDSVDLMTRTNLQATPNLSAGTSPIILPFRFILNPSIIGRFWELTHSGVLRFE